jgi:putative transposase
VTGLRRGGLGIGDQVLFQARVHTVVGLAGTLVRLADEHGQVGALHLAQLQASPGFAIVAQQTGVRVSPAGRLERLPEQVVARAVWWEGHILEVLTGRVPDAAPGTPPRPAYDPAVRSLAERERAKAAELAAAGQAGVSVGTVRRKRLRYQTKGLNGLVDGRADRQRDGGGRVDARVVAALEQAIAEATDASSRTVGWFRWRTEQLLAHQHGVQTVEMPSRAGFYRLFAKLSKGRHTTGSARTRRSLAGRPPGPFGQVTAARPGELVQIDSTPLDVLVLLEDGVPGRVELTGMVDLATRSVPVAVLVPSTKSVDAALLLARCVTPEPMRPGWPQALAMARSVLPHRHLLAVDERLEQAAARPVIVPETIVCDRGKAFMSQGFRSACRWLGISLQPAHPHTPTDKPHIERTIESVGSLFAQFVAGFAGSSAERRGRNIDQEPLWSLLELQNLLDEWLIAAWQNRPHDGLRDPAAPGRAFSPNQRYAALVQAAGYVPVALSGDDYVELLPGCWRAINAYGIKLNHRTYDSAELNPLRRQDSGVAARKHLWEIHYDPYDVTRVWVRNHWGQGWITVPWRHLGSVPVPFGELAWDHARGQLGRDGTQDPDEQAVAAAVGALLEDASRGPTHHGDAASARDRKVAARTRATSQRTWPTPPAPEPDPQAPDHQDEVADAPVADAPVAEVVPLGVFDPYQEATKPW